MRKRTVRMLWLVAGGVVLGLLAIAATSYVMRLDQNAEDARVPIGGSFELVDQDGRVVTEQDFAGRLMLVYFGYTFCPDVCPTSLQTMSVALEQLGDDAEEVAFVFITLDPKRDTVAQMKTTWTCSSRGRWASRAPPSRSRPPPRPGGSTIACRAKAARTISSTTRRSSI